MNHVYIPTNKRQETVLQVVQDFYANMRRQFGIYVRVIHTDGETALGQTYFARLAEVGIAPGKSAAYTKA